MIACSHFIWEFQTRQKMTDFNFLYYFQHCPSSSSKICFNRVYFRNMKKYEMLVSVFVKVAFLKKICFDEIKLRWCTSEPFQVFHVVFHLLPLLPAYRIRSFI